MSIRYLDLADFLIIAEAVLGSSVEQIALQTKLALADSALHVASAEFNRDKECQPLVAVEERMVLHQMRAQHRRLGGKVWVELFAGEASGRHAWTPPPGDEDGEVTADVIIDLAAGSLDDEAIATLAEWMAERIS